MEIDIERQYHTLHSLKMVRSPLSYIKPTSPHVQLLSLQKKVRSQLERLEKTSSKIDHMEQTIAAPGGGRGGNSNSPSTREIALG